MKCTREMPRLNKKNRGWDGSTFHLRGPSLTQANQNRQTKGASVSEMNSHKHKGSVSLTLGKKTIEKAIMPSHIKNSETQYPLVKQCTSSKGKMEPKLVLSEVPSPLSDLDYDVSLFLFSDPSIPSHWIYETWFCPTTLIKLSWEHYLKPFKWYNLLFLLY